MAPNAPDRRAVLQLAGAAQVDPRTADRALRFGPMTIRSLVMRARIIEAIQSLGLVVEHSNPRA